jgi:hypothetical protein
MSTPDCGAKPIRGSLPGDKAGATDRDRLEPSAEFRQRWSRYRLLRTGFFALLLAVSVLSAESARAQAVTGVVTVSGDPIAIGVNPETNKVYVANASGGILVINGATGGQPAAYARQSGCR